MSLKHWFLSSLWPERGHQRRQTDLKVLKKALAAVYPACHQPFDSPKYPLRTRREAFQKLQRTVQAATDEQLAQLDTKTVLWSAVGMYCFFRLTERPSWPLSERTLWRHNRDRSARFFLLVMQRVLRYSPEAPEETIGYMIAYLSQYSLWARQTLSASLILRPLAAGTPGAVVLNALLDLVKTTARTGYQMATSRHIVRVMYDVFDFYDWPVFDEMAARAITRLLKMYRKAARLEHGSRRRDASCAALRKGLEVTVRRVLEHVANSDLMRIITYMVEWTFDYNNSEEVILTFGTVLEHAAMVHVTNLYQETFTDLLFSNIMELVGSRSCVVCRLGNRVLQHLLDRHENREEFSTPRIYFQNTHFNVNVAACNPEDKDFLKTFRKKIHSKIVGAALKHCNNRHMIECMYTTVCLLAAEIPCGYTAAVVANLCMNLQGAARNVVYMRTRTRSHLHAFVIGTMSLLCWLHNAPDFYKYVNKVIAMRAEQAPHLNPPIRNTYTFAQHHVMWDKSALFFDVWEVRYSLWMRFKVKHAHTFLNAMNATAPPTRTELAEAMASGLEPSLVAHVRRCTRREKLQPFLRERDAARDAAAEDAFEATEEDPRLLELELEEPLWEVPWASGKDGSLFFQ